MIDLLILIILIIILWINISKYNLQFKKDYTGIYINYNGYWYNITTGSYHLKVKRFYLYRAYKDKFS